MKAASFLIIFCFSFAAWAQEPVPRFMKYSVLETGCSYYLPDSIDFELALSEDGAKVITGEVLFGDYYFSTITVEFVEGTILSEEDKSILLESYLEYLMTSYDITESAGFGRGHTLDSAPSAIGIIDYWVDSEGTQFAVKGWCNETHLAVLCIYGSEAYPHFNAQQIFLDGFRFP